MITCLGITSSGARCTAAAFSEKRKSDNFDRLNLLCCLTGLFAVCQINILSNSFSPIPLLHWISVGLGKSSLIAILSFERRSRIYLKIENIFLFLITKQICYIVVQNRGFQFAKGPKITLRGSNDWHWHIVPSDYCTDQKIVSFGLNC